MANPLSKRLHGLVSDLNMLSISRSSDLKLARTLNEIRDRLEESAMVAEDYRPPAKEEARPAFEVQRPSGPVFQAPPGVRGALVVGDRVRNVKYGWTGRVVALGTAEGAVTAQVEWDRGQKGMPTVSWAGAGSLEKDTRLEKLGGYAKTVRQIVNEANAEEAVKDDYESGYRVGHGVAELELRDRRVRDMYADQLERGTFMGAVDNRGRTAAESLGYGAHYGDGYTKGFFDAVSRDLKVDWNAPQSGPGEIRDAVERVNSEEGSA